MRRAPAFIAALAIAASTTSSVGAQEAVDVVRIDLTAVGEPVDPDLAGLSWNDGESLAPIEGIAPRNIRVDARLETASTAEGVTDLGPLLANIAEIRRVGATPLVILSYMPPWLGEPRAFGRDPTRVAPADLDKWETLIETVVRTVATAPAPAHHFEVWNEPDIPTFFQDLPPDFADMAERSHRAVATVAAETGLPLEIGGPATVAPDPLYIVPYVQRMVDEGLPLDFVSWHYYANNPFFGPDGNEGFVPDAVYEANARRNPAASPRLYGDQPGLVEQFLAPVLAGTDRDPDLLLTEWNISAGGFDHRHATHEGAAFATATLIELERGGLDGSDYYRAVASTPVHEGDWAAATDRGDRRPVWWVLRRWNATIGGSVLPVSGDDPDGALWARSTRGADGRIDVFLAGFTSDGSPERAVDVALDGQCDAPTARLTGLDAGSSTLDDDTGIDAGADVEPTTFRVIVPSNSAAFLEVRCAGLTSDTPAAPVASSGSQPADMRRPPDGPALPATGGWSFEWLAFSLAGLGVAARMSRRFTDERKS